MFSIRPNLGSYSVTALLKYFQILVIYHIWLGHSLFNLDIPKTSHLIELVPSPRIWRTNYLSWLLTTYLYEDKLHRQKCVYSHSSVIVVINFIIALIFITDSGIQPENIDDSNTHHESGRLKIAAHQRLLKLLLWQPFDLFCFCQTKLERFLGVLVHYYK